VGTEKKAFMDNNYLWDRSGEIDPDIQQLEDSLGTLRYQPQPLQIPAHLQIGRRRGFYPLMAIAATIALIAIALGLWFAFKQRQATLPTEAKQNSQSAPKQIEKPKSPQNDQPQQAVVSQDVKPPVSQKRHREPARNLLASNRARPPAPPELTPAELAEKEQVLVALRLVSAKLNVAQRKTQGLPAPNSIRNQHKIG
jgi:cytoskeletal protein RodZ